MCVHACVCVATYLPLWTQVVRRAEDNLLHCNVMIQILIYLQLYPKSVKQLNMSLPGARLVEGYISQREDMSTENLKQEKPLLLWHTDLKLQF